MPYYPDNQDRDYCTELTRKNVCSECGGNLSLRYDFDSHKIMVVCNTDLRHDGIAREYKQPLQLEEMNIPTRRKEMAEQHGEVKAKALMRSGVPLSGALTKLQAMDILRLVYPEAPDDEIIRCAILCRDMGLHPLMKEVFLIPFKRKQKDGSYKKEWSTVVGIPASRKMAANRKGAYSFIDDTPRAATQEEIERQYGKDSDEEKNNLISICKVRGEKGNESIGFGLWPKGDVPYGTDKGNTKRNMANIRSERQATDRLPGEAIPRVEIIDEAYVEGVGQVNQKTGEIIEGESTEIPEIPPEEAEVNSEENIAERIQEVQPSAEESIIDLGWLKESLTILQKKGIKAYSNESMLSYMKISYKVEGTDIYEIASKLDKSKATHLAKVIQDALDKS